MWIITGLGNPGRKYSGTRHNIGFRVIDRLSEEFGAPLEERDIYQIGRGAIGGQSVLLMKPLTFMNRSGLAVKRALRKFNIKYGASSDAPYGTLQDSLIVVHDDLDLDTGSIRIRRDGSSGGHRGIESIIQETGTKDFLRIRVGIGRDRDIPADEYVLGIFRPAEKILIKDAIINATEAVVVVLNEGVDKAMNKFNRSMRTGPASK